VEVIAFRFDEGGLVWVGITNSNDYAVKLLDVLVTLRPAQSRKGPLPTLLKPGQGQAIPDEVPAHDRVELKWAGKELDQILRGEPFRNVRDRVEVQVKSSLGGSFAGTCNILRATSDVLATIERPWDTADFDVAEE
jgi:hypothetical protein